MTDKVRGIPHSNELPGGTEAPRETASVPGTIASQRYTGQGSASLSGLGRLEERPQNGNRGRPEDLAPYNDGMRHSQNGAKAAAPPGVPPQSPPVAGGFQSPDFGREAIYTKMKATLSSSVSETTMARLYSALSVIDASKLTMAIDTFELARTVEVQTEGELVAIFYSSLPVTLPNGVMPAPVDLLLQLQCFFFFPFRSDRLIDDYGLIKGLIGSGLGAKQQPHDREFVTTLLVTATAPRELLTIKTMIDDQLRHGSTHPRGHKPKSRERAIALMGQKLAGKLERIELEKLCDAFAAIANPAMIELMVFVSLACNALSVNEEMPLVEMLKRKIPHEILIQAMGEALARIQSFEFDEIEDIKKSVSVMAQLYFPFLDSAHEFTSDNELFKHVAMLARDPGLAEANTDVIVDTMHRLDNPRDLNKLQAVARKAMKLN